jgi:hypothetical protein
MKIDDKLKKYILEKLVNRLSHVEVIPYEEDIWFIDRDKKYWYLKLTKDGHLSWRWIFFQTFFQHFSLETSPDYAPIIREFVEQTLKRKVTTAFMAFLPNEDRVEQILNSN